MADNDQDNEEFKFEGMDSQDSQGMGDFESGTEHADFPNQDSPSGKKDVKKNAMIVVGIVVGLMVAYQLVSYMMSDKSKPEEVTKIPALVETKPQPKLQPVLEVPVAPIIEPVVVATPSDSELAQKVAALELSQNTMRSQVNAMNDKVNSVSDTVTNLNIQIIKINQSLELLNTQLAKQSAIINQLVVRIQPKRPQIVVKKHYEKMVYYINAVIPGRAWLIATNGSTLTVREGTQIPGYGVVKLIDSIQGRVITSSGKIIRFSQEDS